MISDTDARRYTIHYFHGSAVVWAKHAATLNEAKAQIQTEITDDGFVQSAQVFDPTGKRVYLQGGTLPKKVRRA